MDLWVTLDGQPIVDGLRVWDYNLDIAIVDVPASRVDGKRSSSMNGQRMWVYHPTTRQKA